MTKVFNFLRRYELAKDRKLLLVTRVLLGMAVIDGLASLALFALGENVLAMLFLGLSFGFGLVFVPLMITGHDIIARVGVQYFAVGVMLIGASYFGREVNLHYSIFIGAIYPFVAFKRSEAKFIALTFAVPLMGYQVLEWTDYGLFQQIFGFSNPIASGLTFGKMVPIATYFIVSLCYCLFAWQAEHYSVHLQELILKLEDASARDARTNNLLNNLIRTVCHDIANPLTVSMGTLAMLRRHLKGEVGPQLDRMDRANAIMSNIINNVRHLQALRDGKGAVPMEAVLLTDVFEECQFTLQDRLQEKAVELVIVCDAWVQANRVHSNANILAHNVMLNLLTNAIKYSSPGSSIELRAEKLAGNYVRVTVNDRGIGIPTDLRPRLFDAAAATQRPGTNNEKGTGFGLPIAKSYLDLMGAKISVESRTAEENADDHGTEFAIVLACA